jgi:hypothetical protein
MIGRKEFRHLLRGGAVRMRDQRAGILLDFRFADDVTPSYILAALSELVAHCMSKKAAEAEAEDSGPSIVRPPPGFRLPDGPGAA